MAADAQRPATVVLGLDSAHDTAGLFLTSAVLSSGPA